MSETVTTTVPAAKPPEGEVLKKADQPMTLAEAAQLKLLDASKLKFFKAGAHLRLTIENEMSFLRVNVLRAFPLSKPNEFFSLRDSANKEIGVLCDPAKLDTEGRKLVNADVERRYFLSTIKRIISVKERFGTVEWDVETERGQTKFTTRDLRESVLRPSPGRYIITDVEGNRFDVLNFDAMDASSQMLLLRHV
jgi:hypothetical protein